MKILSLSEAKMKLSGLIEAINTTDEEVVITRNGRPAAVLISTDEFESMKETIKVSQNLFARCIHISRKRSGHHYKRSSTIQTPAKSLKMTSQAYGASELVNSG